jgi:hypothetical protein
MGIRGKAGNRLDREQWIRQRLVNLRFCPDHAL